MSGAGSFALFAVAALAAQAPLSATHGDEHFQITIE